MYNGHEHRLFGLANLDVLNSFFDEGERAAVVAALSFCGKLFLKQGFFTDKKQVYSVLKNCHLS